MWYSRRLQAYLAESGIQTTVQPRVVWAGEGFLQVERPAAPVWLLRVPHFIEKDIEHCVALPEAQVAQVRRALAGLDGSRKG